MIRCETYLADFLDCEASVVFTKDPQYIVNAHSWPEEVEKNKLKPSKAKEQTPKKTGFVGTGVSDIFKKKQSEEQETETNAKEAEEKGKSLI